MSTVNKRQLKKHLAWGRPGRYRICPSCNSLIWAYPRATGGFEYACFSANLNCAVSIIDRYFHAMNSQPR